MGTSTIQVSWLCSGLLQLNLWHYRPDTERPYLGCVNIRIHECHVNRRTSKPCEHTQVSVSWLSALGIAYACLDTCNSDIAAYRLPQVSSRPFFFEEGPVMDWKSSLGVLSQQLLPEWCQVGTIPKIAALSTVSLAIFISPIITMPLWVAPASFWCSYRLRNSSLANIPRLPTIFTQRAIF